MRGVAFLVAAAVTAVVLCSSGLVRAEDEAEEPPATVLAADHLGTMRHAVVIGIDDYADSGIPDLRLAESGARAVLAVLQDPHRGGLAEANVQAMLGADASAAKIREALKGLQGLPKEAAVLVYFAGHLAREGEATYWMAQDSKDTAVRTTAIEDAEVRKLLAKIPAERVFLIMDCGHPKVLFGGRRARVDHEALLTRYHDPRYATLGAAAFQEQVLEGEEAERSVFGHYLLQGLTGTADSDEDGVVSLHELARYVFRRVRTAARNRRGLETPVSDPKGVHEASLFFLALEPEGFGERLLDEEEEQTRRGERLAALAALRADDRITEEQARLGRHFLSLLPEGLAPGELEQRKMFADLTTDLLDPAILTDALAAIRRADRKTLVVPDAYKTIQAAVDAAQPGDTVFVKAGEYVEHIVFTNGIRLYGEGRERTVVRMVPGAKEILLAEDCTFGSIESMQFHGVGGTKIGDWSPDGIHLNRSTLSVIDVLAHGCLGGGLYASGVGCRPHVRECTFEDNISDGACFSESDGGLIVDCICRSNGALGVQVRKIRGSAVVRACECEFNEHGGIGVSAGAAATVRGNSCTRNKGHGILIWDPETSVTIEDNTCSSNKIHGIYMVQSASAVVKRNTFHHNEECGVVVSGAGTRATLQGNNFLGHDAGGRGDIGGIVFRDGAAGDATSNTCEGNACGILVMGEGTKARLRDNTCQSNTTSGITFWGAGTGHAIENQCSENGQGITISKAKATLEGNTLRENKMYGIFISQEANGTASENRCENNEQAGIHVTDAGTRAMLTKNTCTSNGTHGIEFAHTANGTADGNECSENKAFGIVAFHAGTRPIFRRNRCTNNGRAGFGKEDGAAPLVEVSNVESGNGK